MNTTRWILFSAVFLLTACATKLNLHVVSGQSPLAVQNSSLEPSNGGSLIDEKALEVGDIILSSAKSVNSVGIQLASFSAVSHAAIYVGNGQVIEAVGTGVSERSMERFVSDEAAVVAFRHPRITVEQSAQISAFAKLQLGSKYNNAGIVMQAPFILSRKVCELPLLPELLRDACIRSIAAIALGAVPNDRFFCSQLVMEAYKAAGLPLAPADSRLVSPADLLHMRQGDVPSVRTFEALQYVGHLKYDVLKTASAANAHQN